VGCHAAVDAYEIKPGDEHWLRQAIKQLEPSAE
jgi:hypothetical protein